MLLTIATIFTVQTAPGPLDAYQANVAAINAVVEFEFTANWTDYAHVAGGQLWSARGMPFVPDEFQSVVGRWGYDGTVEYFYNRSAIDDESRYPKSGLFTLHYTVPFELIYDGRTAAWVYGPLFDRVNVQQTELPPFLTRAKAALPRWSGHALPVYVEQSFAGHAPTKGRCELSGRSVEVETYRGELTPTGSEVFEIYYDPSVGYLPRLARQVVAAGGGTTIVEMYLVEARRCKRDGFVPTEWYRVQMTIDGDYGVKEKANGGGDLLNGLRGKCHIGHFLGTRFHDGTEPVALERLDRAARVVAPGRQVSLRKDARRALSLEDIESMVGIKGLSERPRQLAVIDDAELREHMQPAARWNVSYTMIGVAVLGAGAIGAVGIRFRRRSMNVIVIIGLVGTLCPGCSRQPSAVVSLKARFTEPLLLCAPEAVELPMTMVVRNDGTAPVVISRVDGGCSCRHVDQSRFPVRLKPDAEVQTTVHVRNTRHFDGQRLPFTLETNHGNFAVGVNLRVIPRHVIDPDGFSNSALTEGADWTFELVRRDVVRGGERMPDDLTLSGGRALELTATKIREGVVDGTPGWRYRDTSYRAMLVDNQIGLHKEVIRLRNGGAKAVLEVPIVWRRSSFLSSSPDRVILGSRPIRVFLRCPDETVELTKVESAPPGVKVVVSSTRELTVMLSASASGVIDGEIEVGTTVLGGQLLRIPVVRYAPTNTAGR